MILTTDEIEKLARDKHKHYKTTVEHASEMSVHVNGDQPKKLLEITRPNEPKEIKKYRLDIWQPVTKSSSDKVINVLQRVYNPRFYNISIEGDDFKEYLHEDYPVYGNFLNFIRETYTSKDLEDPNALAVIEPINFDIPETENFDPVVKIYPSDELVNFVDGEFYILKGVDWVKAYDTESVHWYKKKDGKWIQTLEYFYNFDEPPCLRLGGMIKGRKRFYFESFISGVLPHWNRVVTMSSDLDAGYIGHMYLEKWEFETDCDFCAGKGKTFEDEKTGHIFKALDDISSHKVIEVSCPSCEGKGKVSRSPWGVHTINRDALAPDAPIPTPPAGYIDKPVEIITKAEEKIEKETQAGFSAINLEILNKVGENQSGVAKTIDREDLNSFLQRWANHVFEYFIPQVFEYMIDWRYPFEAKPTVEIQTPKEFSVLSLEYLTEEYKAAKTAGSGSRYLGYIEEEIIDTKFSNNPQIRQKEKAISKLTPFKGRSVDELMVIASMQPERRWETLKALHIGEIVELAISENSNFLELDFIEQKKITDEIAQRDFNQTFIPNATTEES